MERLEVNFAEHLAPFDGRFSHTWRTVPGDEDLAGGHIYFVVMGTLRTPCGTIGSGSWSEASDSDQTVRVTSDEAVLVEFSPL